MVVLCFNACLDVYCCVLFCYDCCVCVFCLVSILLCCNVLCCAVPSFVVLVHKKMAQFAHIKRKRFTKSSIPSRGLRSHNSVLVEFQVPPHPLKSEPNK